MRELVATVGVVLFAVLASNAYAQEKQALRLVQTIPLPGVKGRLDHMGADLEKKRLFVATVDNNTLEVVRLTFEAERVRRVLADLLANHDDSRCTTGRSPANSVRLGRVDSIKGRADP